MSNVIPQNFIKHEVENEGDWSEWVNPNSEQYFMKCCDCGLVHEMQFKVAKYSENDECEFVEDANLQAVFRARRTTPPAAVVQDLPFGVSGGLVAIKTLLSRDPCVHANTAIEMIDAILKEHPAAPVQEPVQLTIPEGMVLVPYEPSTEMQEQGSTASDYDLSQKRARHVYQSMIDMHVVREGKQARSAPVQEPVAWMGTDIEGNPNKFRLNPFNGGVELYKKPQSVKVWDAEGYDALMQELELWKAAAQRQWVGLTDEEKRQIFEREDYQGWLDYINAIEAKLKERNNA